MVQGKVDPDTVDPVLVAANGTLGRAREQLSSWHVLVMFKPLTPDSDQV